MIEISSLCTGYGKDDIIHGVSLECEKGRITTLIGPNGCGKSTLLKAIIGMLPIREGDIKTDGISISEIPDRVRAQKIAYLSQGKNIPDISVKRMVLHGRFPYLSYPRKYRKCDYAAAEEAMCKMGITELSDRLLCELSGGMRQQVYIAMALCQGADNIILDEPATYLDISHQLKIYEICRELAAEGKTILTVSHDIISALKYSDKLAVMCNGEIVQLGTPNEIVEGEVLSDVFGVNVIALSDNGVTEYCYRKCYNKPCE